MNTKARVLLSLAAALTVAFASGAKTEKKNIDVTVDFENPTAFTDIEAGSLTTEKEQDYILSRVTTAFTENAKRYLPDGYSIKVKVSDIDLAGAIEPWQYRFEDVRIMREIYPPRVKFNYTIRNASNEIVSDGNVNLKDFSYLLNPTRLTSRSEDTAFYVSSLVKDWLRSDVRRHLRQG